MTEETKPEATPVVETKPTEAPQQEAQKPEEKKSGSLMSVTAMIVALAGAGYTVMKTQDQAPQTTNSQPAAVTPVTEVKPVEVETVKIQFDKSTLCRNACLDLKKDYVTGVWIAPGCHCVQGAE